MSKYCIECGNELPDEAKFCIGCGKPQVEQSKQVKNETVEEFQESTGPAALELKAAYSTIEEVSNILDEVQILERTVTRDLENKLYEIFAYIDKAKKIDSNVVIKDPSTNMKITCDIACAETYFLTGFIGMNFVIDHSQNYKKVYLFDVPGTNYPIDINYGKISGNAQQRILRKAQKNFEESNKIVPTDISQFYIALLLEAQTKGINRLGDYINDINGQKIFLNPISKKKAKQAVYDAYQRVIDLYPNSNLAVEAHKKQTQL